MEVLQHFSIRWLSLDLAVNRILRVYKALTSYFRSTDEMQARCLRLRALFEDPLTEVRAFIRKLMSKFLKPAAFRTTSLESVDLQDQENQLPDTQLGIGLTTKSTLIRLHEAGSPAFFCACGAFWRDHKKKREWEKSPRFTSFHEEKAAICQVSVHINSAPLKEVMVKTMDVDTGNSGRLAWSAFS
ncbi:hypothetical protein KUCAC02_019786 [Chaenocephalus aceratus]|uniref:Uncharacterized protein n=1 Tax=Chaenocephalus aceratus TaxID=36190 RepID=A0ACB9VPS9_CHAAC|nr:hypothetical protein KUCAC02_019786 [Chaenocephalus aceratus]